MRRIGLAVVLGLSLFLAPLAAEAQETGKTATIGYLSLGSVMSRPVLWPSFVEAMRELGYAEGRNLLLKPAYAEFNIERLPSLAAELVQARADVIVTTSTRETLAARRATSTTPIVMTLVPDPVGQGFAKSLARPGGNVTGLTNLVPGLSQKYVELLKEAVPSASRFVVVAGLGGPLPQIRHELEAGARQVGIAVSFTQVSGPDDIEMALMRAKSQAAGGIIVALDTVTYAHRLKLAQLATKHRLPGIYWAREYAEDGGLMTYAASLADVGRRAAYFVDRILKGAKPGDLPIEQPTKFELVMNLKTAKTLGLTIPPSLLLRADQVIE